MTDENKVSDLANICTEEADRERFLKALRKLKEAGVTLIDDQEGRPRIIGHSESNSPSQPGPVTSTQDLLLDQLESMFEIEDNAARDPYNAKPKRL